MDDLLARVEVLKETIRATGNGTDIADQPGNQPHLFEQYVGIILDSQALFEDDLREWNIAFSARQMPLP